MFLPLLQVLVWVAGVEAGGGLAAGPGMLRFAPLAGIVGVPAAAGSLVRLWPPVRRAAASGPAASPSAEDETYAPIGGFLKGVKRAIPWVAGLFLLAGLAAVVVTCWLKKGVLLQDLSAGRGKTGAGAPQGDRKRAAEYLARVRERHAAAREEEAAKGRGGRPGRKPGENAD